MLEMTNRRIWFTMRVPTVTATGVKEVAEAVMMEIMEVTEEAVVANDDIFCSMKNHKTIIRALLLKVRRFLENMVSCPIIQTLPTR